ncbi:MULTISPECIES: winged helix-turn-helix transcriptional regulator [unclassified Janthinobacterium]|uniref:winged helix-turn-helix transcriptional regulator n=1 Tax=unclassified Janthinobacterium TaxID=2610881 RepID=UPI00034BF7E3|nr:MULTISPECIES: helix-turn-helix domain-containing protein [unclassified Janthinobacterium]MEC5159228.1 DNA-binding HxlR family transcriptional regulator [Janthinobacterium sp. CG_S6]
MNWSEIGDTLCPIARCLAVVGDRWTMLIMRELFFGNQRFDGLQAQTGMSPHLLSTRLKRLEGDGVLAREVYHAKPRRYQYCLTAKGEDLFPIVLTLAGWGDKWGELDPALAALNVVHRHCGKRLEIALACSDCGEQFDGADLDMTFGVAYDAERAGRAASFQANKVRD